MSDIDTAVVMDGLKALDLKRPIREADMDVGYEALKPGIRQRIRLIAANVACYPVTSRKR